MNLASLQIALDSLGYKKNPLISIPSEYEFADILARDTYFSINYSKLKKSKTYIYIESTTSFQMWQGENNPALYDNSYWKDISVIIKGSKGEKGEIGPQGIEGLQGEKGDKGDTGINGADGREIEVQKGTTHIQWRYIGETDWRNLVSLIDLKGEQGLQGEAGLPGVDGKSAYQSWIDLGNNGTEQDFIDSLKGEQGIQGIQGKEIEIQKSETHIQWKYTGDVTWNDLIALSELKGEQGIQGEAGQDGINGTDGKSAYQSWLDLGNTGSETDFVNSLQGEQGIQGIQGPAGNDGQDGADGVGVPTGGTAGQILKKKSGTNYDTEWADETVGAGTGIDDLERVMGVKW